MINFSVCLQKTDENQYLHIDLLHLHWVTRVATQGKYPVPGCTAPDAWVTSYMLQFRQDMSDWQNYTENGVVRVSLHILTVESYLTNETDSPCH